ncbi:MAG: hypothetical protein JOZ83_09985 [Silvibacterium sp.]|nr:hypothetical protein [Silvibacterium sp.]
MIRITRLLFFALAAPAFAQSSLAPLPAIPEFPLYPPTQPVISRDVNPLHPFSVVGPRGTILGSQDGSYEAWMFPWKLLTNMRISAEMKDYPVPIDVNLQAAAIDVRPGSTTITFSHANFTVREIITAPRNAPDGAGAIIFYQIEAVRPMDLTFSFTPVMVRMWPAPSAGPPSPEWVKTGNSSGFYILHLNFPDHAAGVAMPTAEPGIMQPYQELARVYPLQFVLHFDPARDSHTLFPLLLTKGNTMATASRDGLYQQLSALDRSARSLYEDQQKYENDFLSTSLSIDTPDQQLNDAFKWSEVSIDQLRVQTIPAHDEEALTAGFVGSGDSARPGFGWFFGRDALWTLYAVNSYGDYNVTRREIEFLIKRQRDDGKIMHEWSQTASLVDWKSLPYEYAAADATLLFPMALSDYLKISGDQAFINTHWPSIARAWNFITTHDSDGDGIYDNSQGTGWVESWVPSMPHQEIYMAALDEQASLAFANLAGATGHPDLARAAETRAAHIRAQIEKEYFHSDFYSFSWNANNTTDDTATIFPSVAWWDGDYSPDHSQAMLSRWASAEFSTDWGTRIVSDRTSFYDPISYHQGSVWPLYTGWVSLAEYRAGRSLSGYAHLRQNADLIFAQDLGNATELLSGQFFQPLGRSTAHQLWSAAMIITPILRGVFGLEWNAAANELTLIPSLPAEWDHATLSNIPVGQQRVGVEIKRDNGTLSIRATGLAASQIHLVSRGPGTKLTNGTFEIPLPAVEAGITQDLPEPGSSTQQMKVLDQQSKANSLTLRLAAPAGTTQTLWLRINRKQASLRSNGVSIPNTDMPLQKLQIEFPTGADYVEKEVSFTW